MYINYFVTSNSVMRKGGARAPRGGQRAAPAREHLASSLRALRFADQGGVAAVATLLDLGPLVDGINAIFNGDVTVRRCHSGTAIEETGGQ